MQTNKNPGYRGRVRSGCLTCRARKVKCDEARPGCDNCARLDRTCTYQPRKRPRHETSNLDPQDSRASPISPPLSSVSSTGALTDQAQGSDHPYVASVDAALRLERALQGPGHRSLPPSPHDCCTNDSTPAALVSRDIELTTTMDFLAAEGKLLQLSSATFVEDVECPGITPYDPVNWKIVKHSVVEAGQHCSALALGINAVSALHKAQVYNLSSSRAMSLYESTKTAFDEALGEQSHRFELSLLVAFLLCLFELIHAYIDAPVLRDARHTFQSKLETWSMNTSTHSEISRRVVTWLKILFATTLRGGRTGLITKDICQALPIYDQPLPGLHRPKGTGMDPETGTYLFDILQAPLFDLYVRLQALSGEIAHLTHYHRSRTTGKDQEEVVEIIRTIKAKLRDVWENRCPTARQSPEQIRSQITSPVADRVISLLGLCAAAYHTEIVEIDRVLGDPVSQFTDSRPSLRVIKDLVDGQWAAYDISGNLNPGYLRPLFLYAIECMDEKESEWAARRLAEIKNPISRSDFFSAFAKGLSSAQALKDRRVTSKYFCVSSFGVQPPFM